MLSDITRESARKYGILIEEQHTALCETFIIDPVACFTAKPHTI